MTAADAYAAVVLAGGAARRLGGVAKPAVPVAGRPMLHRVLAAVADAAPRVVVGPPDLPLPAGVIRTLERPPGAGPVAAAAAGLALVPSGTAWVALLAADLPMLDPPAVAELRRAATGHDGAVFVDGADRPQWLCGVWRTAPLTGVTAAAPAGAALGRVLAALRYAEVRPTPGGPPPWYDCDTAAELRQAEEWTR